MEGHTGQWPDSSQYRLNIAILNGWQSHFQGSTSVEVCHDGKATACLVVSGKQQQLHT